MPAATTLRIAIGDYPHTLPLKRGEIVSPWLSLDFVEAKPMHTAFKPMVREHAFDASEMALATYLQAVAYKKGLKLLPAAMLARFQHGTVLYNSERGVLGPNDLAGKRIGVRSYSQTTGVWMRGILQDITQMLLDGELDAAIYGAAMPKDARLKSVVADPDGEARVWYAKHHLVPVNHMVVVTDELARANPDAVAELYRLLEASKKAAGPSGPIDAAPFGKEANRPCLELLISYAVQQQQIPRALSVDELW